MTEIAELLMPASGALVDVIRDTVLQRLASFFGVDLAFLRRNDHDIRATILVSEWPPRPFIPDPDPLGLVYFDDDEQLAMSEHMTGTFILRPAQQTDGYRQRVDDASGIGDITVAVVPLTNRGVTVGCLGFIRFGDRAWSDNEVQALQAIASMLVQLQARVDAEESLSYLAYHDDLTGLGNRAAMMEHLGGLLEAPGGQRVAVIFVDVDDLKVINDALGHETGDELLKMMGCEISKLARDDDFVGRMNADEFIVIVNEAASQQAALLIAERIRSALSRHLDVGPKKLSRTVSIGVTIGTAGESTADALLSEADAAMYAAKAAGKNAVRFFDDTLQAEVLQRFEQEMNLRLAIDNEGEIIVHYQPEVDILTGEMLGVEALVRWNHPERGLLPAAAFIETAEACGLVVPLGRIVLKHATAQLAAWAQSHPDVDIKMRINASPAQLVGPDFVSEIGHALCENGLPASSLCIEVTEHVVMDHLGPGMDILHQLRELGVELAIDDFGNGYSSMAQLKQLPVDTLKIDRAFITDLPTDERDQAIVGAMVGLAIAFDLDVVAEGVETEAHILELAKRGCRRVQGYLVARPMAAEFIDELLGKPLMAGSLDLAAGDALKGAKVEVAEV